MIKSVSHQVNFGKMVKIKEVDLDGKKLDFRECKDIGLTGLAAEGLEDVLLLRENPEKAEKIRNQMRDITGDYVIPEKPVTREENDKNPVTRVCVNSINKFIGTGNAAKELDKIINDFWEQKQNFTEKLIDLNYHFQRKDSEESPALQYAEDLIMNHANQKITWLVKDSQIENNLGLKISAITSPDKFEEKGKPKILVKDIDFIA